MKSSVGQFPGGFHAEDAPQAKDEVSQAPEEGTGFLHVSGWDAVRFFLPVHLPETQ
jgi:hypothetical protein